MNNSHQDQPILAEKPWSSVFGEWKTTYSYPDKIQILKLNKNMKYAILVTNRKLYAKIFKDDKNYIRQYFSLLSGPNINHKEIA